MQQRYLVVFGGCLTQFTVIGLLFCYGLLIKQFEAEFGWSRLTLSFGQSVGVMMMGVLAAPFGMLADKLGPGRVLAATGLTFGIGYALLSQVTQPWHLFALFATLIGAGLATHDVVTLSAIAKWFSARRGIMTAVVKVGTAAGQVALPPFTALLIAAYGWRDAVWMLGLGAVVLLLIAAASMRKPPIEAARGSADAVMVPGIGYGEARRSRPFWTLCAVQLLFFPTMMTVPLHLAPHGMDLGMTAQQSAILLSVIGAASVAGRLVIGGYFDKVGGRTAYTFCLSALIASLGALAVVEAHGVLYFVVAVYGFAHGAMFVVVSPTVAEYFGMRAHGAIFGSVVFFGTIGGAIGPILAGALFDWAGSYFWAFTGLMAFAAIALVLILSLPRPTLPEMVQTQT